MPFPPRLRSLVGHAAVLLASLAAALGAAGARAALPAPVKNAHPHVFLDAGKLAALRASLPQPRFAARGSLQFRFTPQHGAGDLPVFDAYDSRRNHLFVRHVRSYDTSTTVGLQLALQADQSQPQYAGLSGYVAAVRLDLPPGREALIEVSWDAMAHTAQVRVNGVASALNWARQPGGAFYPWQPDGQRFAFGGRPGEQYTDVQVVDGLAGTVTSLPAVDLTLQRAFGNLRAQAGRHADKLLACADPGDPATCGSPVVLSGPSPSHPLAVQDAAAALGLAYQVSGEARHLDAALNYASQLLAVPLTEGGEFYMRGRIFAMGLLYDWLWSAVSTTSVRGTGAGAGGRYDAALAARITATIAATGADGSHPLGVMICGRQPLQPDPFDCAAKPKIEGWDPVADVRVPSIAPYYLSGHHRNNVLAIAAALAAIAPERPGVVPMIDTAYQHFARGFDRARQWVGRDGGHQMGWYYGSANSTHLAVELWRSALDWGATPPPMPAHATRQFLLPLYGLRGTVPASFPAQGDTFPGSWDDAMAASALHASQHGDAATAPVAQWLYDELILPQRSGGGLWDLLLWRPGQPRRSPDALPLSRHFGVSGQVVMRESWQLDSTRSTLLDFRAASFTSQNHQHFDQNSLSLFYRAPLLVDSGYYDAYGSSHWNNYYVRSIAHNTALVFDPAEVFSIFGRTWSNDGGQWLFDGKAAYPTIEQAQSGPNALGGVLRYEHGADYTFTVGDASRAYAAAKVEPASGYLRHVLFLRQPVFWPRPVTIVYDQLAVRPGKEGLAKSVLWHTVNEPLVNRQGMRGAGDWAVPAVAGTQLTEIVNGDGSAFLQTLLPAAPVLRKIGGVVPGGASHRFTAPVRQADGRHVLQDFPLAGVSEATLAAASDAGAWRLEVTDATPKAVAHFLHVISVADSGSVGTPPAARRLQADPGTEALLLGESLVVVFRQRGVAGAGHTWRAENALSRRSIVTGLQPNQKYAMRSAPPRVGSKLQQVSLVPDPLGSLRASPQGVLVMPPR